MNFYVYCVGDELRRERLEGVAGILGAPARLIEHASLCVVVSPIGESRVRLTRENVMAHNRVISHILAETTPLPFRFGVVADEERLRGYVEAQKSSLSPSLEHVRGCVEMSVKLARCAERTPESANAQQGRLAEGAHDAPEDDARTMHNQSNIAERGGVTEGGIADVAERGARSGTTFFRSGTAFLEAKRRALAADARLQSEAEEAALWLASGVAEAVRDADVRLHPTSQLLVRAAHLVERSRLAEYRARLDRLRREPRAAKLRFLTSGAWPPYSFSIFRSNRFE